MTTQFTDDDNQIYDIAMDDVFANGYDQAGESVPTPLSQIQPGDRLELCGKPYASGGRGMDWVQLRRPADAGET